MKFFKWRIISEESFQYYTKCSTTFQRACLCHRWFSGWKDLDIVWDYLLFKNIKTIERTREEYANARSTSVYGESKK